MKQISIKMLDDKDLEFIEALRNLKVSKKVASLIAYLANANEASSREIEVGTNLRQPEVSIAMNALRENNWIEQRNIKTDGKGRPMIVYKLGVPLETIIKHFEEESNRESAKAMESIQRLKYFDNFMIRRQPRLQLFSRPIQPPLRLLPGLSSRISRITDQRF